MSSHFIYCDHNASTPVHSEIQSAYLDMLSVYGNASSLYQLGRQAKEAIEESRQYLANCIDALPDQLIFTGSGTESNNQVLLHCLSLKRKGPGPFHVLISAIEHSSVKEMAIYLETWGIECDFIPVDSQGRIHIDAYEALFKPYTCLVSIVLANNEIGVIQDIKALVDVAHQRGALFHTDAVQALGKHEINTQQLGVDFMSFSSHKIYAPKGVGALYIKDESNFTSLLYGGHHERGLRASTENVPGIMAFGLGIQMIDVLAYQRHTGALIKYLKHEFLQLGDVSINGVRGGLTLSNTLNVTFRGCSGYALAMNCDLEGIAISTGSACSVGSIEPSHVLAAIGVSIDDNKSSVRFSVGITNTLEEMEILARHVKAIVHRLRNC